jgi:DNA-binding SARP family transcriptional activator
LSIGELLPGWYDDWVLFERERVRQLHLHILEAVAEALSASGRFGVALEAGLRAVQVDPLRESAHRLVMEIHLAEGNIWEALRRYEECSRLLWKELRVAPSGRMRELVQAVTEQVDGLNIQPSGR